MAFARTTLSDNWQWRLADSNGQKKAASANQDLAQWTPCKYSPSVIHMELLAQGLIEDFNVGENERLIQWVGECDWMYSCSFSTPENAASTSHADLVFEGLDTVAVVQLNGKEVLRSENMFVPRRVPVKEILKPVGEMNEMVIVFESAPKRAKELETKHGYVGKTIMRGGLRNHLRKAQYHWGWDWGPAVLCCGPYLPVHVETYNARIGNIYVWTDVAENAQTAEIHIEADIQNHADGTNAKVTIANNEGTEVASTTLSIQDKDKVTTLLQVKAPQLWWPNGEGAQPLYTARVELSNSSSILFSQTTRFGIRTIKVVQRPLSNSPGKTFLFNVNGRDIFCQGADWIPTDNLIPRIGRDGYFAWMDMAVRSNLNMIRVWGGGIYETEDFFDACDEKGLLIWYDYAFACGDYPLHPDFLALVEEEIEAQTKRMRGRASLALLCGGNEDFMIADHFGKKYDHSDLIGPFEGTEFPQRKLYLDLILKIAEALAPHTKYWPNSPWGGSSANDETIGDTHMWDVWHLKQLSYQSYKTLGSRFVSEFGMHGFPCMRTVHTFCPDPREQFPQSKTIDCHNKGHGAETRIARYLAENFRYDNSSLANFAWCSQILQSEALGYALRDWKRAFNGPGDERCAGAVIWQLNDCYPVTSWAYVDCFLRPKPAFYMVRRCFARISVGLAREPNSRWVDDDAIRESEIPTFEAWAHNTGSEAIEDVSLVLAAWDFHSQRPIEFREANRKVNLRAGCNTDLGKLRNPDGLEEDSLVVLRASIVDAKGKTLARVVDWPEPFRYLIWPKDTKVTAQVTDSADPAWENQVTLSANYPVKACFLDVIYTDGEGLKDPVWEDNMLDLMPDEELSVGVNGLCGRKLTWRFLNDWELSRFTQL